MFYLLGFLLKNSFESHLLLNYTIYIPYSRDTQTGPCIAQEASGFFLSPKVDLFKAYNG